MHATSVPLRNALASVVVVLLTTAAAHAQINDRIRGAPSEANHFIATPRGWQHPKTAWGEPDIQAQLDMMQAAGITLERCATSYRAALAAGTAAPGARRRRRRATPACDMNKSVAHGRGVRRAHGGAPHARRCEPAVRGAGQLGPRDDDGPDGPEHSAAADER